MVVISRYRRPALVEGGFDHPHGRRGPPGPVVDRAVHLGQPGPVGQARHRFQPQVVLDPPEQVRARACGGVPGVEAVETPVGQAQHPRGQTGQQIGGHRILRGGVRADLGVDHGVAADLGQRHHPGLLEPRHHYCGTRVKCSFALG